MNSSDLFPEFCTRGSINGQIRTTRHLLLKKQTFLTFRSKAWNVQLYKSGLLNTTW